MKKNNILNTKNKKRIFFISTTILFFSTTSYPAEAGKYDFSTDIYNQEDALRRIRQQKTSNKKPSKAEIDAEMEAELNFRKLQEVKKIHLHIIQKKLESLETKFSIALKEEWKRSFIETIGGVFNNAPMVGALLGKGGTLLGVGVGVAGRIITHKAKIAFTSSDPDAFANAASIVSEMNKLELEAIELVEGLATEPGGNLTALEKAYVRKKRKIKDPALQRQIEEEFLKTRQSPQFGMSPTQFIEDALRLPLGHKIIEETPESIEARFNGDPDFKNYSPVTREVLKNILLETAKDSRQSDDTDVPLRRIFCFHGIASGGKTTAAQKIAKFFGLPYIEKSIGDFKDLNEVSLEGSRSPFNVNTGWFIRPFLEQSQDDGRTYSNAFLIINDSDNILSPNNPAAKAFYANYFDPGKNSINNKYFKIDSSIRRLTIIITTNTDVEKMPENLPLTSRLTFVPFPRLKEEDIKPKLDKTLESFRKWEGLPDFMRLSYVDSTQIKIDYNNEKLREYGIESIPPRMISIPLPQNRPIAKVKKSSDVDKITNIGRFSVAVAQEGDGQPDLANFNHLSFGENTKADFCSRSNIVPESNPPQSVTPRQLENSCFRTAITELGKEGREMYNQCLNLFKEANIKKGQIYFWKAFLRGHPTAVAFHKEFKRLPDWQDLGRLLKPSYPDKANEWYLSYIQVAQEHGTFLKESKARFFDNPDDVLVEKLLKFLSHSVKISCHPKGAWTTPLHIAAEDNNERLLNALLKGQNPANIENYLTSLDSADKTPFHSAAFYGNKEILLALLLKHPKGINQETTFNHTPIISAVEAGHLDIVKLLHAKGANMTLNREKVKSVLHYALKMRNKNIQQDKYSKIVEFLLEKSPPIVDSTGQDTGLSSNKNYKIINRGSIYDDRFLSVDFTSVLAVVDEKTANDKFFRFIPSNSQGYYFIENVSTRKVIQISEKETVNAKDPLYSISEDRRQLFQLVPKGDAYFLQTKGKTKNVLCVSYRYGTNPITHESNSGWHDSMKLFQIQK